MRSGELRHAEWSEFNFETCEWRILAGKMKMREIHIIPLSPQAISILEEVKPLTGKGKYVFPGVRYPNRPMPDNTLNESFTGKIKIQTLPRCFSEGGDFFVIA